MVRFSPKTHEKRWFGDRFKRHEGSPAPRIGKFRIISLTQPRSKGYFEKFPFLGQEGKEIGKLVPPQGADDFDTLDLALLLLEDCSWDAVDATHPPGRWP